MQTNASNQERSKRLKLAFIAPYPAEAVLPLNDIKEKYHNREHAAPWVRALSQAMAKREEIELRIFVESRAVTKTHRATWKGVDFTFIPKLEPSRSDPYHRYWPSLIRLRKAIRSFQPDIVHGFGTESSYGYVASQLPYPSVVFIQGIVEKYEPYYAWCKLKLKLLNHFERKTTFATNGMIAETRFARDWALSVNPNQRVPIIPHSLNLEFLNIEPDYTQRRILVIGSLMPRKGVDTIIKAFARTTDDSVRLVLIGRGGSEVALKQLARDCGIADRVDFVGQKSPADVMREMSCAICMVIGARMDTSPNVVTEAHAAALPVIGTAAGGIPDMIDDGEDGFLVPVDDDETMSNRMNRLIGDPALVQKMGAAGREKVRVLNDPDRIAAAHMDLYRDVLANA